MSAETKRHLSFWIALGVLVVVGVVLGIRSKQAVTAVLAAKQSGIEVRDPSLRQRLAEVDKMRDRDSLLATALPTSRDPFRKARSAPRSQTRPVRDKTPEVSGTPSLRALLFDNVAPTVQLSVGSVMSGWLHKGDSFHGWTVEEITSSSVRVSRDGSSIVLPSS